MIEKAEKQQTLADFLLLAQNVEKELASAVQSIDMVQDEKKPLLKTYLKSEPLEADPLEERLSDEGQAEELVRLNMDSHSVSFPTILLNFDLPFQRHFHLLYFHLFLGFFSICNYNFLVCHLKCHLQL